MLKRIFRENYFTLIIMFIVNILVLDWVWAMGVLLFQIGVFGIIISHFERKRATAEMLLDEAKRLVDEINEMKEPSEERSAKINELAEVVHRFERL